MTQIDLEKALIEELHRIAPDIEISEIDKTADLREEFDIDSMDFLTLVTALSKKLDVTIAEADYGQIGTFDDLLGYLGQNG